MKINYNLKTSKPSNNFVIPLIKYLESCYDLQTAAQFKGILQKINELRNRATCLNIKPEMSSQEIDKNIEMLSTYTKYALVILNRFNWNSNRGICVQNFEVTWLDSFQPKLQFTRNSIMFDVFCCYYNLAIMYITRSFKLAETDLESARKDAINKSRSAAFLLRQMKDKYYKEFMNCNFIDTAFPHLDILESISQGLIYKCLFQIKKEDQYKIGISKIAAICGTAARFYYKAYSVAETYFMNPCGITDKTKSEIMALTYFESLYLDVMTNMRYSKHYENIKDDNPSLMSLVLAYERKGLRLIDLGLKNPSVEILLNMNPKQKAELVRVKQELKQSYTKNVTRNKQIYKQREIAENQIPPPDDLPQEFTVKIVKPQNLTMEDQGQFSALMSEESYMLAQQLMEFSKNKKLALENSMKKLDEEIDKAYNDSFVNFYLQLTDSGQKKNLPKRVQEKIHEIRKLGGQNKIVTLINRLKQRQKNANQCFMQLRQQLNNEEYSDTQRRNHYGNAWNRKPSNQANSQLTGRLQSLEDKYKIAQGIDTKTLEKYQKNLNYIQALHATDEAILAILPKTQQNQFVEANKMEFAKLKQKTEGIRKRRQMINQMALSAMDELQKPNYPGVANKLLADKISKQDAFKHVFANTEKIITNFNAQCVAIKEDVKVAATVSVSLNSKNKDQDRGKRDFQAVINCYNEIYQLVNDIQQGIAFYDKLDTYAAKLTADIQDYVAARKISAQQLENSLNKRGGGGGGGFNIGLPDMFPGMKKASLPEFVPPPIPPSLFDQFGMGLGNKPGSNPFEMGIPDTLNSIPSDPFGGPVYKEGSLQFPSNPFMGPKFESQYIKK